MPGEESLAAWIPMSGCATWVLCSACAARRVCYIAPALAAGVITALDHPGAGWAAARPATSQCDRVPVHQSSVCAEAAETAAYA